MTLVIGKNHFVGATPPNHFGHERHSLSESPHSTPLGETRGAPVFLRHRGTSARAELHKGLDEGLTPFPHFSPGACSALHSVPRTEARRVSRHDGGSRMQDGAHAPHAVDAPPPWPAGRSGFATPQRGTGMHSNTGQAAGQG